MFLDTDSAVQVIAVAYERWQNAYGKYLDVTFPDVEVSAWRARAEVVDEEGGESTITAYFDHNGELDTMIDDCHGERQIVFFDGEYVGGSRLIGEIVAYGEVNGRAKIMVDVDGKLYELPPFYTNMSDPDSEYLDVGMTVAFSPE